MLQPQLLHSSPRQRSSSSWKSDDNIGFLPSLTCRSRQTFSSSPHQRPRPGRRRTWRLCAASSQWLVWALVMISMLSAGAQASTRNTGRKRFGSFLRSGEPVWDLDTTSSLGNVPKEIVFDRSPVPGAELRLYRRQGGDIFESVKSSPKAAATVSTSTDQKPVFSNAATAVPSSASSDGSAVTPVAHSRTSSQTSSSSSDSSSSSPSETGIMMAPGTSTGDLPKVFDGGLGSNYTEQSCLSFLQSMISNQTFSDCLPLSLLLQVILAIHSDFITSDLQTNSDLARTPCPSSPPPNRCALYPEPSMLPVTSTALPAPPSCPPSPPPCAPMPNVAPITVSKIPWCDRPTPASSPTTLFLTHRASKPQGPQITNTVSPTPSRTRVRQAILTSIIYHWGCRSLEARS